MTINNKEYQFIEGMNWYQWFYTKYNTDNIGNPDREYDCFNAFITNENNQYMSFENPIVEGTYKYWYDLSCYAQ